jgi:hypothetical protein
MTLLLRIFRFNSHNPVIRKALYPVLSQQVQTDAQYLPFSRLQGSHRKNH